MPADRSRRGAAAAAAAAARRYLDGDISYDDLMREFSRDPDPDIDELLDAITHEPSRGGFFGVSDTTYFEYREQVLEIVRRLETAE